jgi:hypothetical protein
MFTAIGCGILVLVGFLANREQNMDSASTDDYIRCTRQDIRMVVWLLGAVVVMLGIIADRIH